MAQVQRQIQGQGGSLETRPAKTPSFSLAGQALIHRGRDDIRPSSEAFLREAMDLGYVVDENVESFATEFHGEAEIGNLARLGPGSHGLLSVVRRHIRIEPGQEGESR